MSLEVILLLIIKTITKFVSQKEKIAPFIKH